MINIKGLIKKGKITGGYFVTSIINNALPFAFLPVLTHYLRPEDYANITLFSTYFAVFNSFSGAALNAFIANVFYSESKEYLATIIGNSIIIISVFSVSFMLILLGTYIIIPTALGLSLPWLLITPVASFGYLLFQLALGVMRNQMQVLNFSYHQIGNTLLNTLISLLFVAVLVIGWEGRVLGILISFLFSAALSVVYLRKQRLFQLFFDKEKFKKILRFTTTLIPNSLQSVLVSKMGILFIQFFSTKEILGIYSVGFQVSYSVMILIITLDMSWSPYFFKQLSKDENKNKMHIVNMFYIHILAVIVGVALVNIFGSLIIKIMTSQDYYSAEEFIPWLTLGFLLNSIVLFSKPALIKAKLEKDIGLISGVNLVLMILLNYSFTKMFGYIGVAYAFFATYFAMFILLIFILILRRKTINLPWLKAIYRR